MPDALTLARESCGSFKVSCGATKPAARGPQACQQIRICSDNDYAGGEPMPPGVSRAATGAAARAPAVRYTSCSVRPAKRSR